ncbi:MAG: carbohydrate ABC transporter permease [Clostridiales bacterium]|nr:carbohydrate ABC transporter permease [Clostridiales bacterium]
MASKKHRVHLVQKRLNRSFGGDIPIIIFLIVVALAMALPIVYAVGNAFKPLEEFWMFPPHFWPENPTFQNFRDMIFLVGNSTVPFSRYLFNTVFITVVGTTGLIILASMCAFPLAKRKFPGSKLVFSIIVTALMFNGTVTAIPSYMIMSRFHMIDTYWAIIVPAFGLPIGLYLMKQFMEQMIPDSLLEAAVLDGAGDPTIFLRIVMPLVRPAWLTLIIFSVQNLWGIGQNVLIYSEELKTLAYALSQFSTGGLARAGVGGAVNFVMLLVPILVFVLTQSNITQTMATSGMKD